MQTWLIRQSYNLIEGPPPYCRASAGGSSLKIKAIMKMSQKFKTASVPRVITRCWSARVSKSISNSKLPVEATCSSNKLLQDCSMRGLVSTPTGTGTRSLTGLTRMMETHRVQPDWALIKKITRLTRQLRPNARARSLGLKALNLSQDSSNHRQFRRLRDTVKVSMWFQRGLLGEVGFWACSRALLLSYLVRILTRKFPLSTKVTKAKTRHIPQASRNSSWKVTRISNNPSTLIELQWTKTT